MWVVTSADGCDDGRGSDCSGRHGMEAMIRYIVGWWHSGELRRSLVVAWGQEDVGSGGRGVSDSGG